MKKSYKSIILFGVILALLTFILQYSEYRYIIGQLDADIYTSIVATLFTIVGVWIGVNLLKSRHITSNKQPQDNSTNILQINRKDLKLNNREFEILNLIAQGLSNQEIADQLFLALPTIKTHISNLYAKLDVRSRTQAIVKAQALQLI